MQAVRETVRKISGVSDVRVDLNEKRAWVSCSPEVSTEQVKAAIESSGSFHAKLVEQ